MPCCKAVDDDAVCGVVVICGWAVIVTCGVTLALEKGIVVASGWTVSVCCAMTACGGAVWIVLKSVGGAVAGG